MINLIDTKEKEKNKGCDEIDYFADDEYSVDTIDPMDPINPDEFIDPIDDDEIMLNVEWVQALIDLDEEGYND